MSNSFLKNYVKDSPKVGGIKGIRMNAPYAASNKLADIGLELELEGRGLPPSVTLANIKGEKSGALWTTHADGSLRNGGVEYVLSRPCFVDEAEGLVKGLYDTMSAVGTRLRLSNRCSTHVHVNVGGKKINQITSAIALWTTFEESLINWCGEERTTNHFCLSSKDQGRLIEVWDQLLSGQDPEITEGMKYSALNIRTIRDIGSIEFRTMRADEDYTKIVEWAKFCHGLVDYASTRYQNPQILASDLSERSGLGIFVDICNHAKVGDRFTKEVASIRDFDRVTLDGFRRAQPLVLGYPWHDWMELIGQEYVPSPFETAKKKTRAPRWDEPVAEPAPIAHDWIAREVEIQAARPAARPIGPLNIGRRVNPDRPIMFGDGTAGEVTGNRAGLIQVRTADRSRGHPAWTACHAGDPFWYSLDTGQFDGVSRDNRTYPWIRNVPQPIRFDEPEDDE